MKKSMLLCFLFLLLVGIVDATAETGKAGYAGAFLRFGLGARPLGMGGAFCAIAEGIEASYYNPAGLAIKPSRQVGFTYHSLTLDRNLNSVAITLPVRNQAVMGFSWINASVSDVLMRDSDRNPIGNFGNSNNSIGLSFSKIIIQDLSVGANLRYLQSKLDELSAYTVGADVGGIFVHKNLSVGLSIQDLGLNLRWDSRNYWSSGGNEHIDNFPIKLRAGVAGSFLDNSLISALDIVKDTELDLEIHAGAEYWFSRKVKIVVPDEEVEDGLTESIRERRLFGLRAGFDDGSLAFGASLYYPYGGVHGGLDYAFLDGKRDDGSYHIFTMRVIF